MTETTPHVSAAPDPATQKAPLAELVGRLSRTLARELSPGDLAELRRLDPEQPFAPSLFKVLALHLEDTGYLPEDGPARDEAERCFAAILAGLAHLGPFHQPGRPLGMALASAGASELRLVRLLRHHAGALRSTAILMARYLAARGEPTDFTDMARLLLSDGRDHAQAVRRQIARDYYRTRAGTETGETSPRSPQ